MKVSLYAVGRRMPKWVESGCLEYQKRLPRHWKFGIREFQQARGSNAEQIMQREADKLMANISDDDFLVCLDHRGKTLSTEKLAGSIEQWQRGGRDVILLIGGADGLHERCRSRADHLWSLSPLTFPHPLVRVIVIEQLYRAQSILEGHPYHRA